MNLLDQTTAVSAFSRNLSEELEEILSDLEERETAAVNAQTAYEETQHASKAYLHDDGSLSASELLEKRKQAGRTLELCEIETARIVRARDNVRAEYYEVLKTRWDEFCTELRRLASEREAFVTGQLLSFIKPELRSSHSVKEAIAEFVKQCDGMGNRRNQPSAFPA